MIAFPENLDSKLERTVVKLYIYNHLFPGYLIPFSLYMEVSFKICCFQRTIWLKAPVKQKIAPARFIMKGCVSRGSSCMTAEKGLLLWESPTGVQYLRNKQVSRLQRKASRTIRQAREEKFWEKAKLTEVP